MTLRDILQSKGDLVHAIEPDATLSQVVDKLVHHNCGSLVVIDDHQLVGIITERDILRAAAQRHPLDHTLVRDHMTSRPITARPCDRLPDVMGLMTQKRIRHLPIVDHDQLVGIISIGDIVKAQHDQLSVENHYLKNYIQS